MDPSLMTLLPTGGVAGVLVVVIVYLLRQNHSDRGQYRADVARGDAKHLEEVKALHEQHKAQMSEVKAELVALRTVAEQALTELEEERRKRWRAEDQAASYRRQLDGVREDMS